MTPLLPYSNHQQKLSLVKSGTLSLKDNVRYFLDRITKERELNCYLSTFDEEALERASSIQKKIIEGKAGKAAGMVIAVKDVLSIQGKEMTASSKILKGFVPLYTATAIQRLIDEDAIIIGKTNCDEFAMGSSNENSAFGPVLNPIDKTRVPGGSSGGSAVAVAAGLCDVAIGTDTGGSIRQPAAFCGVIGLKPTYSRVSRYGLSAFASSFDTIGPFASNVYDAALVMEIIAGHDSSDATSSTADVPEFSANLSTQHSPLKIGIPKEYFNEALNSEIRNKVSELVTFLKRNGHTVVDIELPMTEYAISVYYVLTTAEASSNLARYDGARYGFRSESASSLTDMYINSRSEGFGDEVKRRIVLGTYVLSSGYYDAYYTKAQKIRRLIKNDFENAFAKVDLVMTPTTPTTAFRLGEKSSNPLEMYLSDIYTTGANLAGIPGISLPLGTDSADLPVGIQFLADQFCEENLLKFSNFVVQNFNQ